MSPLESAYLENHMAEMADHYVSVANIEFALEEHHQTMKDLQAHQEVMQTKIVELNSFRSRVKPFMWGLALIGVIKIGAWTIEQCL